MAETQETPEPANKDRKPSLESATTLSKLRVASEENLALENASNESTPKGRSGEEIFEELKTKAADAEKSWMLAVASSVDQDVSHQIEDLKEKMDTELEQMKEAIAKFQKMPESEREVHLSRQQKNEEDKIDQLEELKAEWEIALSIRKEEVDILSTKYKKLKTEVEILSRHSNTSPSSQIAGMADELKEEHRQEFDQTEVFDKIDTLKKRLTYHNQEASRILDTDDVIDPEYDVWRTKGKIEAYKSAFDDMREFSTNAALRAGQVGESNQHLKVDLEKCVAEVEEGLKGVQKQTQDQTKQLEKRIRTVSSMIQEFDGDLREIRKAADESMDEVSSTIRDSHTKAMDAGAAKDARNRLRHLNSLIEKVKPAVSGLQSDLREAEDILEKSNEKIAELKLRKTKLYKNSLISTRMQERKEKLLAEEKLLETAAWATGVLKARKQQIDKTMRQQSRSNKERKLAILQNKLREQKAQNAIIEKKLQAQQERIATSQKKAQYYAHEKKVLARDACSEIERLSALLYK